MERSTAAPRDFYDEEYHYQEDIEQPNFPRLRRAMRHLGNMAGATFLDLGAGVGWATHLALRERSATLGIALDFSLRPLQLGKQHVTGATWVQADGTALPLADASVDRAFSFGSLEHFPSVRAGFEELFRVLRPGGLAVVVVPNFYIRTGQPLEFRATRSGWAGEMRSAGFEIVRVGGDHGPAILKNRRPLRMLLRIALRIISAVPPLRYQFAFVLQRPLR